MRHVFIIGSRGLPAKYGGFETFVEELVRYQNSSDILYHVACLSDVSNGEHFEFNGADCYTVNPPKVGGARVILYDILAIRYAIQYCKKQKIKGPIFYILGNTVGCFIFTLLKSIKALEGKLYVNPDGLEWRRTKWSKPIQWYLKKSEKAMSKKADLLIADNQGIVSYINKAYPWSNTRFIAYGTDLSPSVLKSQDGQVRDFFSKWKTKENDYYLIVGRFVPENNYETMIMEFLKSTTRRQLMVICNHDGNPYYEKLKKLTHFEQDDRILFVGTVYDKQLLFYLRQHAFAYIHGHEVGGTNPGLLEALSHTAVNLVLKVNFNEQVAKDTALYWSKEQNSLCQLIEEVECHDFNYLGTQAKKQMSEHYNWPKIVREYEELFLNES